VITTPPSRSAARTTASAAVRRIERPDLAALAPIDVAERFVDVPGLALFESARPGRNARWSYLTADPIAVIDAASSGSDPFAGARRQLSRLSDVVIDGPPLMGGLVGYLSYDLGRRFERLPSLAADDQPLPQLWLGLHDWVIAWDRREGRAWLTGRAADRDARRLDRRLAAVADRLDAAAPNVPTDADIPKLTFRSGLDRPAYEAGVEAIRTAIAEGHLYQANLTRRLEAPFDGQPWPLHRRLRTGDPALFTAYLDLGGGRAILSASPEPFLAVDRSGNATSDPIKGTRPRGRNRAEDRALACELLGSDKDRAENMMIVDVLRNDLGRVCTPGTVRVPRLCRLERTTAVQHLVSTVTGRLRAGADAFDLLAAAFPGGSITGAPKIRAMELLERLEPVRRGPYTGAIGWLGPDGQLQTSIAIRTFVADGSRITLHVGGGITWRSDPAAEWEETVAKARGPLAAIGAVEADGG
jgi:para-aminobenzoate synthetase component I